MATRAMTTRKQTDWRAAFRRSAARALQMVGAGALALLLIFLTLSLASYTQTDPSASTAAASGDIANWMGASGAWTAERVLLAFGLPAILLLPLIYIGARRLWSAVETDDDAPQGKWWWPLAMLILAIGLFGVVLSLMFDGSDSTLPAGIGGVTGLLGAAGLEAVAGRFPESSRVWIIGGLGLASMVAAFALTTRVFAIDWAQWLTLPAFLRRGEDTQIADDDGLPITTPIHAAKSGSLAKAARDKAEPNTATLPDPTPRRAPEITDPSAPPRQPAKPSQTKRDMFADYELPSLELLAEIPIQSAKKLDKMALERNARLLENVLDDFNVKGEITAVRTGPVVTMYELEPAPGIKASRVVGLAEDIARNMSAISARVSPIPGKTVMGIELPNADRQMVAFRELAACADFVEAKGNLPIILGKDIAGEPIIADLGRHAAFAGRGDHRIGQIGRPECDPAVVAVSLHAGRMPPHSDRSQSAGIEILRRHSALAVPRRDRTAQVGPRAEMGRGGNGAALSDDVLHQFAQHSLVQ